MTHHQNRQRMTLQTMHRSLLLLLLFLLMLFAPLAQAAPPQASITPELAAALDSALEEVRLQTRAPGALLAVALPGQPIYRSARGVSNILTGSPLVPDGRVRIASVTKPFVAVVALQLVQEGWLALDQTVAYWLPGLLPEGERITIRQLLNHTSGLPEYMADGLIEQAHREPERVWAPQELIAHGLRYPMRFAPGASGRWAYSNTNYIVLGLIIERATGNSLAKEIQQRISGPLGLQSVVLAGSTSEIDNLARGYVGTRDYTALHGSVGWAAGGMVANVSDVARFTQALMWHELLKPQTLDGMLAFQSTGSFWGTPDVGYGLGVIRRTLPGSSLPPEERTALGHTGMLGGYRTVAWYFPSNGATIVVSLTRHNADPNIVVNRVLELLAAHGAW
jgi:D-alanyl-D-alanine carboxypeptidase